MLRFAVVLSLAIASCMGQIEFVNSNIEELTQQMTKYKDTSGKKWALLVAGSNTYFNYRHQADICHAYQIVSSHGIPDEQIVVMMYDDIASNPLNPFKGELINHPDGPNVYKGVLKDYVGKDVTPDNFISIMTGKKDIMKGIGSGKVIDSGPNDHVFVFFADHGAPGLIAFPTQRLYKSQLASAIKYMHENEKYKQMVIYIEACESGSMFYDNLESDINVYATTAANRSQSSFACYFDRTRNAYLGDRYSVSWMEDSDKEDLKTETLHHQFEITKKETDQSMVVQFGDMSIAKEPVAFFQGNRKSQSIRPLRKIHDDIPSPDVKIHVLLNSIENANSVAERYEFTRQLNDEYRMRKMMSDVFTGIANAASQGRNGLVPMAMNTTPKLHDMLCYQTVVEWFDKVCYDLDQIEYGYRMIYVLGNLCDAGIQTENILSSINQICK